VRDILGTDFSESGLRLGLAAYILCKNHSYKISMKPGTPVLRSTRLLDQVRERIRYLHYSFSTEKAHLHWVRFFIRWRGCGGVMRHPRDMGEVVSAPR